MLLFHRELGGAGRPPLVILHGMLGSSRNWQTAGRDLAARYHVWALDLRNHGGSPQATAMTPAVLAADVQAWLDARGLGRVTLLGHSLGGKVAMRLACRQPERVERLIVVDIAPRDDHTGAPRAEFAAMGALDLATLSSRAAAERQLEAQVPDWALRKFLTTNLVQDDAGAWRWQVNLPVLTAALPALEGNSLSPGDRFDGATQFILGATSHYVTAADHAVIRHHFPRAELTTLAGAGHNPHLDARAAFVAAVGAVSN